MCLEAIYAWKEQSRLGRPLSRFNNWGQVENDFNVKHAYQVGADAIWWFVGQFLSGNTHDPMNVFQNSWDAFNRGENPVVCIAQNYDFSGAPHCILPIAWDRNVTPWRMDLFDPNFPNQRRALMIDPGNNSFRYDGSNDGSRIYAGDAWSGGRFHYMPWLVLNHRQRTPVWDAILLLLDGIVVIFGDAVDVNALTDEKSNNLDASAAKTRSDLSGKLLRVPGLSGLGPIRGNFYIGKQEPKPFIFNPNVINAVSVASPILSASVAAPVFRPGVVRHNMSITPMMKRPVASDAPGNAIAGALLMDMVRNNGVSFLRPNQPTDLDTIRCKVSGKSNGKLDGYYKRGLLGVGINGDLAQGEQVEVNYERMSGRENEIHIRSDRQRKYAMTLSHKFGAGKDFMKVTVSGLPSEPGTPMRMNFQPGIGVIDVLTGDTPNNIQVTVDGVFNGNSRRSTFNTQVQGGQRLILPELTDPGRLKVGKINHLLGSGTGFRFVGKQ